MIYVASFVTVADYDCIVTDGDISNYSLVDLAQGFTCAAGTDKDRVIAKAKAQLEEELRDMEELTEDDELVYVEEEDSIRADLGADVIACIVIREVEEA